MERPVRQCYARYLRIANKAVNDYYNRMLEPDGVAVMQLSVLKNLGDLGEGSVSELALLIELDRTTVVRALKPLMERGLIEDLAGAAQRNRRLRLTDAGLRTVEVGMPLWDAAQRGVEAFLGVRDVDALKALLSRVEEIE